MGVDSVLWEDGQFLLPHHFQSLESQFRAQLHRSEEWSSPYYYGLHKVTYDKTALSNWIVDLTDCHMRLRDGTKIRCKEDCRISAAAIPRNLLNRPDARLKVYVGLPVLKKGVGNSVVANDDAGVRFVRHEEEVEDENEAGNSQLLQYRKLNPRILFGKEATDGFDALPVAQLRMGASAESPPEIDDAYIPPVLCKEAWVPLHEFVSWAANYLGAMSDQLGKQMTSDHFAFASGRLEDLEKIMKLQAVNAALGSIVPLASGRGIHPFAVYRELCRAVGQIAIFRSARTMPELPVYDHEDIARSFLRLRDLLKIENVEPEYDKEPFSAEALQMTVRLKPKWLAPNWAFYVGVYSELSNQKVNELMKPSGLDMKAGSTEKVDALFREGKQGVRLIPVADPPRVFPPTNWHYFRIDREGDWISVERTLNFGLRFNEKMVERRVDGEDRINVKDKDGLHTVFAFSMFAIQLKKI